MLNGIRPHLIDGVIFNPLATGRRELEARLDQTPIVLLGERVYGGPVDHVSIDNAAAAQAAVTHLLELGRTRIAAIGEQRRRSSGTARLRLRGYTNALKAAGLPVDPDLVRTSESYHRADGAAAMEALLALPHPPDAVFCFNDLLALGALRTLLDRGLRVPQDVAVVGFDDIDECAYSTPSLTTVAPDKAAHRRHGGGPPREPAGGPRTRCAAGEHRAARPRHPREQRGPAGSVPALEHLRQEPLQAGAGG